MRLRSSKFSSEFRSVCAGLFFSMNINVCVCAHSVHAYSICTFIAVRCRKLTFSKPFPVLWRNQCCFCVFIGLARKLIRTHTHANNCVCAVCIKTIYSLDNRGVYFCIQIFVLGSRSIYVNKMDSCSSAH